MSIPSTIQTLLRQRTVRRLANPRASRTYCQLRGFNPVTIPRRQLPPLTRPHSFTTAPVITAPVVTASLLQSPLDGSASSSAPARRLHAVGSSSSRRSYGSDSSSPSTAPSAHPPLVAGDRNRSSMDAASSSHPTLPAPPAPPESSTSTEAGKTKSAAAPQPQVATASQERQLNSGVVVEEANSGEGNGPQVAVGHGAEPGAEGEQKPLPLLPAPGGESAGATTIEVNGQSVALDHLGPMVVGVDGTLSRIANWGEMTELERCNTLLVLGKRNRLRLGALRGEGTQGPESLQ